MTSLSNTMVAETPKTPVLDESTAYAKHDDMLSPRF